MHSSNLYEFHVDDNIETLKKNVTKLIPIGKIEVKINDISDDKSTHRTNIGQNLLDGRHQYEFYGYNYIDCSNNYRSMNALFKYVHELMTVQTVYPQTAALSRLYLRIKLEYKASSWKSAGEPRDINVNLNISGTDLHFANGVIVPIHGSDIVNYNYSCSGDQTILLKESDGYGIGAGNPYWGVQVTGTIDHQLHGGYYHWTNYATW